MWLGSHRTAKHPVESSDVTVRWKDRAKDDDGKEKWTDREGTLSELVELIKEESTKARDTCTMCECVGGWTMLGCFWPSLRVGLGGL